VDCKAESEKSSERNQKQKYNI